MNESTREVLEFAEWLLEKLEGGGSIMAYDHATLWLRMADGVLEYDLTEEEEGFLRFLEERADMEGIWG